MPQALAHFALGAGSTLLVLAVVAPDARFPRLWPAVGGVWALVPDVHWITPVYAAEIHRFHRTSPLVDLFWFHRTLDRLYPNEPSLTRRVTACMLAFLLGAAVVAEWRSRRHGD